MRGSDSKCYECEHPNPIYMSSTGLCATACSNRIENGYLNRYCSLPCGEGTFTGNDGKCYSCNEEKNINVHSVSQNACTNCPDTRDRYNDMCVPKCPADAPLRGADNKCYPCNTVERVNVINMTDACMECYEERTLDGNYCVLKE